MKDQRSILSKELKLAGAIDSEISGLLSVASSIKKLKKPHDLSLNYSVGWHHQSRWQPLIPIGITSVACLVFGMALIILSQTSIPGNMLYPMQKLSDNVSMSIDPSYRGNVMMKRSEEVKKLIADHASSNLVLATLADYQSEALTYKSAPTNYSVYEYCKDNLVQAAALASITERRAIDYTLLSLKNV